MDKKPVYGPPEFRGKKQIKIPATTVRVALSQLRYKIEQSDAPEEQKQEAMRLLKHLLEHPIIKDILQGKAKAQQ